LDATIAVMQATAVAPATSNSKDDSNIMTANNNKKKKKTFAAQKC
jgi:hypothetical protein